MMEPIYISRPLLGGEKLAAYASAIGLQNVLVPEDMHVTLAYSTEPVDWTNSVFIPDGTRVMSIDTSRQIVRLDGGAVVLKFQSREFGLRWSQFIMAGASWDYPEYQPHVTLAYDDSADVEGLAPYRNTLEFGPERRQVLATDWTPTTTT